ncbi:Protein of unknown function [Leuconostoc citreum]|nr:Protein of unknown function [Leuconostoc citreum LBAE E16]CDX65747.1 Protein of unknown function [Leuconostoc citreum]
MAGGMYAYWLA